MYKPLSDEKLESFDLGPAGNFDLPDAARLIEQARRANRLAKVEREIELLNDMTVPEFTAAGGLDRFHELEAERDAALAAYLGEDGGEG